MERLEMRSTVRILPSLAVLATLIATVPETVQDGFPISTGGFQKETWQIGTDGNLLVLLEDGDSLKRISITPSPDTSLSTVVGSGTTQANGN
jgi:hypothetical protein